MRVVLTRPEQDVSGWSAALRGRGHEVLLLPLMRIAPMQDLSALTRAWDALPGHAAAMFVSGNAVQQFFACLPGGGWPSGPRAWATGPGTAAALVHAGVPAAQIDAPAGEAANFDSEALWDLVQGQVGAGARVMVVRGADADGQPGGRDWLSQQVQARGAQADQVAAYRRLLPDWSSAERAAAAAATGRDWAWIFSSSEAVRNLGALLPDQAWSQARAVATHERIAKAARDLGFGVVSPSRPQLEHVLAALESIG